MAVLKDLIVHGRSRFINGIDADSIHANLIDANDGVFKTITTTTLDAETITTDMLKANNARVAQTLTVDGTISTNKWEAANIANIGGNFYISPTGKADSGTITVTKTGSVTINGVSVGTYTLVIGSASFGVTSTNSTVWGPTSGNQSKVIFTGSISYNNSKKYPLGTCNGTMTALSTGTNTLTGFTITGVNSPALDIFFQEVGVSSVSSTACNGYEMQISVYQTYSNSALRPVGILLTSYGKEKKQYIDIYNGENTLGDSASGFANPAVRIGLLDDLPNIVDNSTDTATKPSGWGIYTTNGFFRGKVVANAGRIATWNIGSTSIYSGTNSMTSTTQGTYIGTGTDATSGIRNYKDANTFVNISQGVITAKAVDLTGKITASSGSIGGWNIGTDTNKSLYYSNQTPGATTTNLVLSPTSATNSNAIGGSGTGLTWFMSAGKVFGVTTAGALYSTSGKIGGFDIGATYLRNGNITSATNTSVAGVYLGTDGLNISNGTAATTSYITKTAVNIGNKLTWNGTTLTIDGSASIGGTTASTVVSNAANGAAAKTGLDNLEIGGRNLIPLSFNLKSFTVENASYATGTWTDTAVTVLNVQSGTYGIFYDFSIESNTTYTLSFNVESIVGTARTSGGFKKSDNTIIGSQIWNHSALDYAQVVAGRNIRTFTTPNESAIMRLYISVTNKDSQQVISKIKLEKGNKATDWSPAPEDLDVHKYVTDIDSNKGITIKPLISTGNDYLQIDSTSIDFYRGIGTNSAAVSVMSLSDSVFRMGKSNAQRVEITASAVDMYDKNNKLTTRVNENGLTIYKAGTQVASYGTDATIGQVAANLYNVFIDADSGIALRKNTTSLLTINSTQIDINNSSGNVMTRVNSSGLTVFDGSGTADSNKMATFGSTTTIGFTSGNKYNIYIDGNAVNLRYNTSILNKIDSTGMKLYLPADQTNAIAEFSGTTSYIGKHNNTQSYIQIDYHSLQMIDKEGNSYFYVSDLRNEEGIASITQTFRGDGTSVRFNLSLTASNTDYTVTVSDNSGGTVSKYVSYFKFASAPTDNVTITVSYNTTSSDAKAYTLGWRRSGETLGPYSTAIGSQVTASGYSSLAEGINTFAIGTASHAEGFAAGSGNGSIASGEGAHAEGGSTVASGRAAHSEGFETQAKGNYSHAEGNGSIANGNSAHTEGADTIADGIYSHAEGYNTHAFGRSHAEGASTVAGSNTTGTAHAEGEGSEATGSWSHAQNYYTIAASQYQTAIGRHNISDSLNTYAFIIGNGNSSTRSNALTIDWDGNVNIASGAKYKINGTALSAADVSAVALSDKYTRSSAGGLDWSNQTDGNAKIIAKSALAFWNGSYDGSTSNLTRFKASNGTSYSFGTLASKNSLSAADVGAVPKSVCCFANSVVRTPSSGTITFTLSELGITNSQKPVGILMTYQDGGATPTILRYDYDASSASSVIVKVYDVNGNAVSSAVRFFMMVFQGSWTSA